MPKSHNAKGKLQFIHLYHRKKLNATLSCLGLTDGQNIHCFITKNNQFIIVLVLAISIMDLAIPNTCNIYDIKNDRWLLPLHLFQNNIKLHPNIQSRCELINDKILILSQMNTIYIYNIHTYNQDGFVIDEVVDHASATPGLDKSIINPILICKYIVQSNISELNLNNCQTSHHGLCLTEYHDYVTVKQIKKSANETEKRRNALVSVQKFSIILFGAIKVRKSDAKIMTHHHLNLMKNNHESLMKNAIKCNIKLEIELQDDLRDTPYPNNIYCTIKDTKLRQRMKNVHNNENSGNDNNSDISDEMFAFECIDKHITLGTNRNCIHNRNNDQRIIVIGGNKFDKKSISTFNLQDTFVQRRNTSSKVINLGTKQYFDSILPFEGLHKPTTAIVNDHLIVMPDGYYTVLKMDQLFSWNIERVLWIGHYKNDHDSNDKNSCWFSKIGKDVIKECISFLNVPLFDSNSRII